MKRGTKLNLRKKIGERWGVGGGGGGGNPTTLTVSSLVKGGGGALKPKQYARLCQMR